MGKQTQDSLTIRTSRALGWSYAGVITRMFLSIGINILLARLIGPRPFGQIAVAQILFGFGNLVSSVGITSALIQKEKLTNDDIRFCFTAQMLVSGVMSATLFLSAGLWASFFHQPESVSMLRIFSLLFVFQGFGTTANALLSRKQDMRTQQISSIVSYSIGYLGFGVILALRGAGVWSLVIAQLVQALLGSLISYAMIRHSLVPRLHAQHYHFLSFGSRVLGANLSSWVISNMDNTIVGVRQGPVALGLYSRAFSLAAMPAEGITSSLLNVLWPPMSRVQSDAKKMRNVYAGVMGLLMIILIPAFAGMAVVPDVVIRGLYGQRWIAAIPIFRPLALAIPINAALALAGPVLTARGKPQREFQMQSLAAMVAIVVYYLAMQRSLVWLAWMVVAVYLVRFYLLTRTALLEISGSWVDILTAIWPGLLLGVVAAAAAAGSNRILPDMLLPIRLIVVATISVIAVLGFFLLSSRQLLLPVLSRVPQLQNMVPPRFHRILPRLSDSHV
jgi:O-antigen/teichoic acid export membrane protein